MLRTSLSQNNLRWWSIYFEWSWTLPLLLFQPEGKRLVQKKKTWVLQVISKSWDSSHTFWGKNHPLILSFVGLHVPPSFEAGVNFCLEAGTSLLKPTQCLILTSHHIHQNQHILILVSAQYYSWTRSCGRVSPLSYFEWCLLNQTLIISFSAKAHSHKHLIIHQARKDLS